MADRKVTSRLNMANAVKEVCDTNPSVVALVPAFVLLVATLGDKITALRALIKKLSKKNKGLKENKDYWKERLSLLLSVVCGAGTDYAKGINDVVLEKNFDYPISTFTEMRDTELIEMAQSIIDLQATVAAQLIGNGITTSFMADVTEALDNFEAANPKPIVNVYTTEADNEQLLKDAFALSDFVLQRMMKAALIYKVLNPLFFQQLDNASLIRDAGLRHDLTPEEKAARKEERRLKKEAKAKEAAAKKAAAEEAAAKKTKEASETKDVSAKELLDTNVQEMNTTTENIETPTLPEPSMNGH